MQRHCQCSTQSKVHLKRDRRPTLLLVRVIHRVDVLLLVLCSDKSSPSLEDSRSSRDDKGRTEQYKYKKYSQRSTDTYHSTAITSKLGFPQLFLSPQASS
jgi:hypothetical protein